jgi:hypothetical protein
MIVKSLTITHPRCLCRRGEYYHVCRAVSGLLPSGISLQTMAQARPPRPRLNPAVAARHCASDTSYSPPITGTAWPCGYAPQRLSRRRNDACGTKPARAYATACPQIAKADMRVLTRGSGFDPERPIGVQFCCTATAFSWTVW